MVCDGHDSVWSSMEQDTVFAETPEMLPKFRRMIASVRTRELVLDTRPARFSENRSNMNHIDLMKTLKRRDRRARRLTQGYLVLKHLGRQDW